MDIIACICSSRPLVSHTNWSLNLFERRFHDLTTSEEVVTSSDIWGELMVCAGCISWSSGFLSGTDCWSFSSCDPFASCPDSLCLLAFHNLKETKLVFSLVQFSIQEKSFSNGAKQTSDVNRLGRGRCHNNKNRITLITRIWIGPGGDARNNDWCMTSNVVPGPKLFDVRSVHWSLRRFPNWTPN